MWQVSELRWDFTWNGVVATRSHMLLKSCDKSLRNRSIGKRLKRLENIVGKLDFQIGSQIINNSDNGDDYEYDGPNDYQT